MFMRLSTGYGPRPMSGGLETFSWYFIRVSGIALIFLVIIHLLIMHVTTDVACTTFQFVASRYANPLWRLFDWLLLTLALLHGMNGLRVVVDDSVRSRGWRLSILSLLGGVTLVFFLLGTITLISFPTTLPSSLLGPNCVHFH
jgi:succinate dehydrogenase / fumarate reductase membrane anchor subunit